MQPANFVQATTNFWAWFAANEKELSEQMTNFRQTQNGGDKLLESFSAGVALLSEDLHFNVGGDHELTFAVSGNFPLFYLLPYVAANLPEQYREKWHIFSCMPGSKESLDFGMYGAKVNPQQVLVAPTAHDGAADLRFYAQAWQDLADNECLSAFFTLLDITVGEALANLCIGNVERAETAEEGMLPLARLEQWLLDNVCQEGQIPNPADRFFSYETMPSDNPGLRQDIVVGTTSCLPLINEYSDDKPRAYHTFTKFGAKPVYLYYYFNGEKEGTEILDERYALMDKLEAEVLGQRGTGREIGLMLGGAMGEKRAYIDMLLYDEAAFMQKAAKILADFPHLVFCRDFYKNGQVTPLSDADVAEFVDRLEQKIGTDRDEGLELAHDAAAEIVSIIEDIPAEERDYATNSIYARCLNNIQHYQRALDVLNSIAGQGEQDPRWHYKRGFSLYFIDGREAEAEAALNKAKSLAGPGDDVVEWCDEMLQEIADWRQREKKGSSLLRRLTRRIKGVFRKKTPSLQVTYYTKEEMDTVEAFIQEQFGKYENIFHEIVSEDIHVDICLIPPTEERNYYTIVTMGMGAVHMNVPEELAGKKIDRAEVLLTLPADWDIHNEDETCYWPLRCLKVLAHLPIDNKTWLGWGHTVANQAPFAENTGLSSVMLLMPNHFGQAALKCPLPGGDEIIFYQALPLYEAEMNYKLEHGSMALLNCFPPDFNMVVDINRPNYVG